MPERRAISIKGETYARLKIYAYEQGESMSGFIEDWVAADLDARGVPIPERVEPRPTPPPDPESEEVDEAAKDHFTF